MWINKIQRVKLQNLEHFQYAATVVKMVKEANVEKLTEKLPALEEAFKVEDKAVNQSRSVIETGEIEQLSHVRNEAYRFLSVMVDAYTHSDKPTEVLAAKRLQEVIKLYPHMIMLNYDKRTAAISNLVADLKAERLKSEVTTVGVKQAITRLETENGKFAEAYYNRSKARAAKESFDVKALREVVDKAIDAILWRAEALYEVSQDEKLSAFIQHYNTYLDERSTLITRRDVTNQENLEKKLKTWSEMLAGYYDVFAVSNGYSAEDLAFTGNYIGTGTARKYELSVAGRTETIWVKVKKDKLVEVADKPAAKPTKKKSVKKPKRSGGKKNKNSNHGDFSTKPKPKGGGGESASPKP